MQNMHTLYYRQACFTVRVSSTASHTGKYAMELYIVRNTVMTKNTATLKQQLLVIDDMHVYR